MKLAGNKPRFFSDVHSGQRQEAALGRGNIFHLECINAALVRQGNDGQDGGRIVHERGVAAFLPAFKDQIAIQIHPHGSKCRFNQ